MVHREKPVCRSKIVTEHCAFGDPLNMSVLDSLGFTLDLRSSELDLEIWSRVGNRHWTVIHPSNMDSQFFM